MTQLVCFHSPSSVNEDRHDEGSFPFFSLIDLQWDLNPKAEPQTQFVISPPFEEGERERWRERKKINKKSTKTKNTKLWECLKCLHCKVTFQSVSPI